MDAYSKDPVTGVVLHSAETCIGARRRVPLGAIKQRTPQYSGGRFLFARALLAATLILLQLGTQCDLRLASSFRRSRWNFLVPKAFPGSGSRSSGIVRARAQLGVCRKEDRE